jgi:hypothetical protein
LAEDRFAVEKAQQFHAATGALERRSASARAGRDTFGEAKRIAVLAAQAALDKKASEIEILDVTG